MVWICGRNKPKAQLVQKEERTSVKQKICYGVGHVFNDLCIQAWFTYLIIFFNKIVKISATGTGYIFLSSQIADAISTPFIGYGCDKSLSKRISKKYGNRKIWHLFGSVGIALIWPFVFSPCLVCKEDSPEWVPVAYYGVFAALFSVCWPMVEISHLSLMPHVAKRRKDAVELSAIRWVWNFFYRILLANRGQEMEFSDMFTVGGVLCKPLALFQACFKNLSPP